MNGKILLDGSTREVFKQVESLASAYVRPPETTMLAYNLKNLGFPQGPLYPYEIFELLDGPRDVQALWKGLRDGSLDIVTSEHAPGERSEKEVERSDGPRTSQVWILLR
jgi:hypothetical protein